MHILRTASTWFLSIVSILTFGACGTPISSPPVPIEGTPSVSIITPTVDTVFPLDTPVDITLAVTNFVPGNGFIYLVVDERPPVRIPFEKLTYRATDLVEGSHILRAYLVDHTNAPLTNPEAFDYTNYHVQTNNNLWHIAEEEPVLTIHQPIGTVQSDTAVFAVVLRNFSFDTGYVRIKVWQTTPEEGIVIKLTDHIPKPLNLAPGTYSYSAELYTIDGVALTTNWSWQNGSFTIR